MNNFLKFYAKYNISPVKQDISNFQNHIHRRTSLYRELGLVRSTFVNSDILEVAPGSGYNSIVTAMYEPKSYTLIEPNKTGYNEMLELFKNYDLATKNIIFINKMFEDVQLDKKYDIVICEGLIPGLDNKQKLVDDLKSSTKSGGVIIITTSDEISIFFEVARRFIANKITIGINNIDDRVELLSNVFSDHLSNLAGSSRPIKDWVLDVLINPASTAIDSYYSIANALEDFGNEFYYYASSPNIFDNITWYKKLETAPKDYNTKYAEQFSKRRHTLFWQPLSVSEREAALNSNLSKMCMDVAILNKNFEDGKISIIECDQKIITIVKQILSNTDRLGVNEILEEYLNLLKNTTIKNIKKSKIFSSAFGKGQQYISFVKN